MVTHLNICNVFCAFWTWFYSSAIDRSIKTASFNCHFNMVCHVIPRLFWVLWSRSVKSRWKTAGWQTHKGEEYVKLLTSNRFFQIGKVIVTFLRLAVKWPFNGSKLDLEEKLKSSFKRTVFWRPSPIISLISQKSSRLQAGTDTLNQQRVQEDIYYPRLISLSCSR